MRILEQRVRDLWQLEHGCELIDLEKGFFLVRFYSREDYFHVLGKGPWIVLGHYLAVMKWRPNFRPSKEHISSTMVWIRFPEIPVEFFHEQTLLRLGNPIGRAIKVDDTTMAATRGRYARVCVEIDLTKPLVPMIHLLG